MSNPYALTHRKGRPAVVGAIKYLDPVLVFTCQKGYCGRTLSDRQNDWMLDARWWLIMWSQDTDDQMIVRCPLHITDWSLRIAGLARAKCFRDWKEESKRRNKHMRLVGGMTYPFPLNPRVPERVDQPYRHPLAWWSVPEGWDVRTQGFSWSDEQERRYLHQYRRSTRQETGS